VAEYKNMVGRAGRLGFSEEGKGIVLADTEYERRDLFRRYVLGRLEPLRSSFDARQLETWIVRLLAQVDQIVRRDVLRLLTNTYGGYLAARSDPNWRQRVEPQLEQLVVQMIRLGLVEEEGDRVRLTLLGRVCGRSALSFASAMRLVELLRGSRPGALRPEHLVAIVQVLEESDAGFTPLMRRGRGESVRVRQVADRLGNDIARLLQRFARDDFAYQARCKRTAILWDWINGVPVETIEQQYTANPFYRIGYGDIRRFADSTRFHLRSAHQIAAVLYAGAGPSESEIDALLTRLEVGLPADALDLLRIPLDLTRGEYLGLYRAGVPTLQDVWNLSDQRMAELLPRRASRLGQLRPQGPGRPK
jgi:replicative superfamily II helicase